MGEKEKSKPIGQIFATAKIWLFLLTGATLIAVVNEEMRQVALEDAKSMAQVIMDRTLATHFYFTDHLKPNLFKLLEKDNFPKAYFNPSLMSSTYAVRNINDYSKTIRPEGYYYK